MFNGKKKRVERVDFGLGSRQFEGGRVFKLTVIFLNRRNNKRDDGALRSGNGMDTDGRTMRKRPSKMQTKKKNLVKRKREIRNKIDQIIRRSNKG